MASTLWKLWCSQWFCACSNVLLGQCRVLTYLTYLIHCWVLFVVVVPMDCFSNWQVHVWCNEEQMCPFFFLSLLSFSFLFFFFFASAGEKSLSERVTLRLLLLLEKCFPERVTLLVVVVVGVMSLALKKLLMWQWHFEIKGLKVIFQQLEVQ